jgi:VWFA-related protein
MTRFVAAVVSFTLALAGVAAVSVTAGQATPPSAQQPPQPTFRTGVTIVPVDVRVLDRDGRPVTDLRQADFTVLEDGSPQEIRYFSARGLAPMTVPAETKPAVRTRGSSPLQEQSARIFLIVLGRGRLQYPSKGVDALIHFVRNRLLPQDQVAVLAFNRATDFTTERARILEVLDRYRRRHERIDAGLRQQAGGLAGVYGSREPSPDLQREIDAIFRDPQGASARTVVPVPGLGQATTVVSRALEDAARAQFPVELETTIGNPSGLVAGEPIGLPFEAFVSASVLALYDLGNLYTGIEYLRHLEGEKHILFVTEQGFYTHGLEADASLAARANHARVVIDTIQTGGIDGGPSPMDSRSPFSTAPTQMSPPVPSTSFTAMDMGRIQMLRSVSNLTGGLSAARQYAQPAVDRIDTATRFGYLLGYQPGNTSIDRRYRRITVRVNRPGVTVLFRHGYYAEDVPLPIDRRAFLTGRRIAAAGQYEGAIPDIRLTLTPTVKRTKGAADVHVALNIDASRIAFAAVDGRHLADLDVVIYGGDGKERLVGESRHKIELKAKEEIYQRFLREGIPFDVTIRAALPLMYVKVIVYDYAADLLGSAIVKLK